MLRPTRLMAKGALPVKATSLKIQILARTLRLIGEKGRDAFYKGEIADKIDEFMRANGGFLRKTDFENHTSTWVEPVSVNYRGYGIYSSFRRTVRASLRCADLEHSRKDLICAPWDDFTRDAPRDGRGKEDRMVDRAKLYADPDFARFLGRASLETIRRRAALID